MRFAILGSGSKGNCTVVQSGDTTVLVDVGYAPRETRQRLRSLDTELEKVDALLISHGHGDHVRGAKQLARALKIPTHCTEQTHIFCRFKGGLDNRAYFKPGETFTVKDLTITTVPTPHDAPGSVMFVIDDGTERVGIVTDLGRPTDKIGDALGTCDSIVVEHNHDLEMLWSGPYPEHLKRRVSSHVGHLNNEDGAKLVARAMQQRRVTRVLLAHLSEVNNTHANAMWAARPAVDGFDVELAVAPQHHPSGWLAARRKGPARPFPIAHLPRPGGANGKTDKIVKQIQEQRKHKALEAQLTLFAAPAKAAVGRR